VPVEQFTPSTVFGLTVYNGETHLAEALESLLGQTRGDYAILIVDDCSTDRTPEIARRYAELDPRVVYERNDRQLGLVRNWRRAFDLAGECAPGAPYFAWASDHDVWHPRWLELLALELEAHAEAALAYPFAVRIDDDGSEYPTREHRFETAGVSSRELRLRRASRGLAAAGDLIYGLGRREAMMRCGPFPLVVLPDRLYLVRLALEGEFRQVPRRLWFRRYRGGVLMSNRRQRRTFFTEGVPWWAYVPWPLSQTVLFARSGGGRLSALFLAESIRRAIEGRRERGRRRRRWRRRERRRRYRGLARTVLERFGLRVARPAVVPPAVEDTLRLSESLAALERAELLDELARPQAVVVDLGGPSGLRDELERRFPELVYLNADDPERFPERVDLAISVTSLERLPDYEIGRRVRRLHELGTPNVYSFNRESARVRAVLGRWYWLRDVWVPPRWEAGRQGRKPDPRTGPISRTPGRYRHVVGRRRLLPGPESAKLG
jgi:glycosyltransferase involved in cell wall biosynthesis